MIFFIITNYIFDYFQDYLEIVPYIIMPAIFIYSVIKDIYKNDFNMLFNINAAFFYTFIVNEASENFTKGTSDYILAGKIFYFIVFPIILLVLTCFYYRKTYAKNLQIKDVPVFIVSFGYLIALIVQYKQLTE